jgi:hypothetical protein
MTTTNTAPKEIHWVYSDGRKAQLTLIGFAARYALHIDGEYVSGHAITVAEALGMFMGMDPEIQKRDRVRFVF